MANDAVQTAEQLAEATAMLERGEGEDILYRDTGLLRSAPPARRSAPARVVQELR